jgi:hypothetical protein
MADSISLLPELRCDEHGAKMEILGGVYLRYLQLLTSNSTVRTIISNRTPRVTFWNKKRLRRELSEVLEFLLRDCSALLGHTWKSDVGQWLWFVQRLFGPLFDIISRTVELHEKLYGRYLGYCRRFDLWDAAVRGSPQPHPLLPLTRLVLETSGVTVHVPYPPPSYDEEPDAPLLE